ncbi:hypothetical protein HA466_0141690 [Hirschfeldia incana]|nr:hypothetical protein HA466_0141690 [Hirschfeldia incana]
MIDPKLRAYWVLILSALAVFDWLGLDWREFAVSPLFFFLFYQSPPSPSSSFRLTPVELDPLSFFFSPEFNL